MKHRLDLRLNRLKNTEIYYENHKQKLFQDHKLYNKKACKTLHPITMDDTSFEARRVKDIYETRNYKMTEVQKKYLSMDSKYNFPKLEIPVAFHVIYPSGKRNNNIYNIPDDVLNKQLDVLNGVSDEDPGFSNSLPGYNSAGYVSSGFTFYNYHPEGKAYSRTENTSWFYRTESFEATIKNQLSVNVEYVINVYYADADGYLGWSYFPEDFEEENNMHGLVINYKTILGGTMRGYEYGKTLLHEMGHYFGLYHTFQGGCNGDDGCDDTPAQNNSSNIYDCKPQNTCPHHGGDDPYNNYMNYVDDFCMNRFTNDQIFRMWASLETYKPQFINKNNVGTRESILLEINLEINKGWNIISIPFLNEDILDELRSDIILPVYEFRNGYHETTYFERGSTYFVNYTKNKSIKYEEDPNSNQNTLISKGWNMLGGFINSFDGKDIECIYEFNNIRKEYKEVSSVAEMNVSKGYFVKIN